MKIGLSFDDVLLVPGYSDFRSQEVNLTANLTANLKLKIPLVSSPMDTVTESKLAMALAKEGGLGVIHRNLTIEEQAAQVKLVKKNNLLVGAAVDIGEDLQERTKALAAAGVDVLVVDSAHGHSKGIIEITGWVKRKYPQIPLISGNVATAEGFEALAKAGAEAIRVGLGPGSICTTRMVMGMGVPQMTAIMDCSRVAKKMGVALIADGGIRFSGDMVKALAAGGATVMLGSLLAGTFEAPGKVVKIGGKKYKYYRGMGSIGALKRGGGRYEQKYKRGEEKKLIAEGVEGLVPYRGKLKDFVYQMMGGVRKGMVYVGARNIKQLQEKAQFMKMTAGGLRESHPHDVMITNGGGNY